MDVYVGGILIGYVYNLKGLKVVKERIEEFFVFV